MVVRRASTLFFKQGFIALVTVQISPRVDWPRCVKWHHKLTTPKMISLQIGELEEKVRNMLMLKFGRLVDLEKLETVTVNRTIEELKEKLRQQESKSAAEIAKWNVSKTSLSMMNLIETCFRRSV